MVRRRFLYGSTHHSEDCNATTETFLKAPVGFVVRCGFLSGSHSSSTEFKSQSINKIVQPVTNALLENKVASDDDSEDGYISSNTDAEEETDAGTPGSVVKSTKKSKSEEKFKPFNPEREAREVKEN